MEDGSNQNETQEPIIKTQLDHHVVEINEDKRSCLHAMNEKMHKMPSLLHKSAGYDSCCIFKVPQSFVEINRKAYEPHIVSIGPYHHGKDHLKMIEEHKWRYLNSLLLRTQSNLEDYYKAVESEEVSVRQNYSRDIEFDWDKIVEMMVFDGCFIIEIFRKVDAMMDGSVDVDDQDDPILRMQWIFPFLMRDFIKLENQIPFSVLQCLFNLSKQDGDPSLSTLALKFFSNSLQLPDEVIQRYSSTDALHLLDLLRLSFIPINSQPRETNSSPKRIPSATELSQTGFKFKNARHLLNLFSSSKLITTNNKAKMTDSPRKKIPSATKLSQTGFKFKAGKSADTILDIKYRNGVIEIPALSIDDFATSVFLNCIAFEQCHSSPYKYISPYAVFLGYLISTPKDVELLQDGDIIENNFGTNEEVVRFFNDLGKEVALDLEMTYLWELLEDTNEYYRKTWHVQWGSFKHTYFNTPWSCLSALAAVILLLLTTTQTFFSVYGYIHPPS